jgi:hypothetical protein
MNGLNLVKIAPCLIENLSFFDKITKNFLKKQIKKQKMAFHGFTKIYVNLRNFNLPFRHCINRNKIRKFFYTRESDYALGKRVIASNILYANRVSPEDFLRIFNFFLS